MRKHTYLNTYMHFVNCIYQLAGHTHNQSSCFRQRKPHFFISEEIQLRPPVVNDNHWVRLTCGVSYPKWKTVDLFCAAQHNLTIYFWFWTRLPSFHSSTVVVIRHHDHGCRNFPMNKTGFLSQKILCGCLFKRYPYLSDTDFFVYCWGENLLRLLKRHKVLLMNWNL